MCANILDEERQVHHGLRERQREARDEAILQAAYALMDEKGYEAMTMDELAESAGISKRTLYHHFPSKEAIAVRTVSVCIAANEAYVRTSWRDLPAGERLRSVVGWIVDRRINPPQGPLAYVKAQPALMSAVRSNAEFEAAMLSYTDAFVQIIRDAQQDGCVSPDSDPVVLAHLLIGCVRGIDIDELLRVDLGRDKMVDMLVETILNGIILAERRLV